MAWINLTTADFERKLLSTELVALKAIGLPDGQTWPQLLAAELVQVSNQVRGYCPVGLERGEGSTIPDEVMDAALAIQRMKIFTRFPSLNKLWSAARIDEYKEGLVLLKQWSRKEFNVAPPETSAPPAEQAAGAAVRNLGPRRNYRQTGLL